MDPLTTNAEYLTMVPKYTSIGALAVLIWDILDNISEDYRVLFRGNKRKFSVATVAYIAARLGAVSYSLLDIIFDTAPVGNCTVLERAALAWCPIALSATGFLFFLRLRAIYDRDRILVSVFFVLWLTLVGGSILIPVSIKGGEIGSTKYCHKVLPRRATRITIFGPIALLSFDTLVFLAISWRLSRVASYRNGGRNGGHSTNRIGAMLFGTNLPTFTRSLLVDGQMYYLITILIGISSVVVSFSPGVSGALSNLLGDVFVNVVNIMACRVFRRTKSGAVRESEFSTSVVNQHNTLPIQFRVNAGSVETLEKDVPVEVHAVHSFA
ncbi:hypothetical protein D9619_007645 [Psilocybe cf. subviscida]|uniref:DUF6533 domain-containing protein n=1 Tax=Psilocybe cf. subviscida TaxID=2480587 RepID=A0A8H5ATE1_9AGAR|nr:hypothetical protein D9619_007645 [Psilocybe cf. subviscida]